MAARAKREHRFEWFNNICLPMAGMLAAEAGEPVPASYGSVANSTDLDFRLFPTDAFKVSHPPLGDRLHASPDEAQLARIREYCEERAEDDARSPVPAWWGCPAERWEDEGFEYPSPQDQRDAARLAYRRYVLRSLLTTKHQPTRTMAMLLQTAAMTDNMSAPNTAPSWAETILSAARAMAATERETAGRE